MCAGKNGAALVPSPPLVRSVLSEPWLTLTSLVAGSRHHSANKHKYSVCRSSCVTQRRRGHLHYVDIDNQTVNRVASNNQLIMNCKWGLGIDPPLAFGMCGEKRGGGGGVRLPMSMIHQAAPFCARWPLTVSLSLALVICCCSPA